LGFFLKVGFSAVREKSTLAKGPFLALVRHTNIIRYQFSLLKTIKIHMFGLLTLAAAGNRTPKAETLLKQAKMGHFI